MQIKPYSFTELTNPTTKVKEPIDPKGAIFKYEDKQLGPMGYVVCLFADDQHFLFKIDENREISFSWWGEIEDEYVGNRYFVDELDYEYTYVGHWTGEVV